MTGAALALLLAFVDPVHDGVTDGNAAYDAGDYEKATAAYGAALEAAPESAAVQIDLANALYKGGRFAEALSIYRRLAVDETAPFARQAALNAAAAAIGAGDGIREKDPAAAQTFYREGSARSQATLARRPEDDAARKNLELALKRIEESPPPPPEQEDKQNQQDQDKKDQEQKPDDSQESDGKKPDEPKDDSKEGAPGEPKDEPQNRSKPDEGEQGEPKEEPQPQEGSPSTGELSPEQAERILNAIEQDERKLREQMRRERAEKYGASPPGGKDW